MYEFKKVTKEQAEEFAEMFFGRKIEMVNTPLDEFTFEEGAIRFKDFKNYGRECEKSYPFEFPLFSGESVCISPDMNKVKVYSLEQDIRLV